MAVAPTAARASADVDPDVRLQHCHVYLIGIGASGAGWPCGRPEAGIGRRPAVRDGAARHDTSVRNSGRGVRRACGRTVRHGHGTRGKPVFQDPFDGHTLQIREAKTKTAAIRHFKETGENVHVGDATATGQGKDLFDQWCQVCHAADGSGKMCPPLIGTKHIYPQMMNDPGMFSILYAGAPGAMQSFAKRPTALP